MTKDMQVCIPSLSNEIHKLLLYWFNAEFFAVGLASFLGVAIRVAIRNCFTGTGISDTRDAYGPFMQIFFSQPYLLPNFLGCFLMSIFISQTTTITGRFGQPFFAFLTTGLCGSITTFSAWIVVSVNQRFTSSWYEILLMILLEFALTWSAYTFGFGVAKVPDDCVNKAPEWIQAINRTRNISSMNNRATEHLSGVAQNECRDVDVVDVDSKKLTSHTTSNNSNNNNNITSYDGTTHSTSAKDKLRRRHGDKLGASLQENEHGNVQRHEKRVLGSDLDIDIDIENADHWNAPDDVNSGVNDMQHGEVKLNELNCVHTEEIDFDEGMNTRDDKVEVEVETETETETGIVNLHSFHLARSYDEPRSTWSFPFTSIAKEHHEWWCWFLCFFCVSSGIWWSLIFEVSLPGFSTRSSRNMLRAVALAPLGVWLRWGLKRCDCLRLFWVEMNLPTLTANMLGVLCSALIVVLGSDWSWAVALNDGFNGSLTTVSTLFAEIHRLYYDKGPLLALRYILCTFFLAIFIVQIIHVANNE